MRLEENSGYVHIPTVSAMFRLKPFDPFWQQSPDWNPNMSTHVTHVLGWKLSRLNMVLALANPSLQSLHRLGLAIMHQNSVGSIVPGVILGAEPNVEECEHVL